MRRGSLFAWAGLLLTLLVTSAQAERRLAFVAGVNAYANLPTTMQLERAVADAETISATLQDLGFAVTKLTTGVTHEAFLRRFGEFTAQIEPGDTVLVFFAGHGVGLSGANYLLPADVPLPGGGDERLVRNRSIAETDLIEDIRGRGARVTVMVIDACRNNPFPKTGTRSLGLARGLNVKEPAEGVFSIYSAGFGQEALDRLSDRGDTSPNSVFTRVFAEQVRKPGVNLVDLGETLREEVAKLARTVNHPQVPAVYNQILGGRSVFLAGPAKEEPKSAIALPPAAGPQADEIAWSLIEGTSDPKQLSAFLERFPRSALRPKAQARLEELGRLAAQEEARRARQAAEDAVQKAGTREQQAAEEARQARLREQWAAEEARQARIREQRAAEEAARQARAREQQEAADAARQARIREQAAEEVRQVRAREQAAEAERAPANPFPFLSPLLGPVESRPTPPGQLPPGTANPSATSSMGPHTAAAAIGIKPKKVPTVSVRPDGSINTSEGQAEAEAALRRETEAASRAEEAEATTAAEKARLAAFRREEEAKRAATQRGSQPQPAPADPSCAEKVKAIPLTAFAPAAKALMDGDHAAAEAAMEIIKKKFGVVEPCGP